MIDLGQDEMAKYPFLADSGKYLRAQGFTLEQFGSDPDLKIFVDTAFDRIQVAANGHIFKSEITESISNDATLPLEVFSFLLAVILLKFSRASTLIRRFALAEARRAEKFLERDLTNISDKRKEKLAIRLIKDLSSVTISRPKDNFVISVSDYVTRSVKFHEKEWKLINRRVESGSVFLTPHETIRLFRRELSNYINSKILSTRTPEMLQGFQKQVDELLILAKKFTPSNVLVSTEYPPCVKHAIKTLEDGENLSHSGRFMLATFLLNKGKLIHEIAPLFKNAPDYNESITLYQLNHLAGSSGTKYTCPSCEKLDGQNLCFPIPACNGIFNPLSFGRKRSNA